MSIYSCLIWVDYHVQNWTKYCRKLNSIVKPNILVLCNVTVRPMRTVTVVSGIALCLFFILGFNFAAGLIPLKYYETISSKELRHSITKRGISPSQHKYNSIRELSFHVLGRDFRLILNPSNGLLSPFFKAYTINSVGLKKPVSIQKENFFEGHVFGEKNSDVSVHIEEGMMTASIQTPDETYVVEPAWRHLPDHDNTTMIAYRTSDIKETRDGQEGHLRFCGYVREEGNLTVKENKQDINLVKRQTSSQYRWEPVHTRCSLLLVADHLFYQNMGGSDLKGTINYLISLIDRVNKVYLETEWNSNDKQGGFRGMGFVIQEVMVHTESTPVVRGEVHYNMADYEWNVRDLLEVFSRSSNHRTFCLAHLFTDQKFDGGILGLAYVGSPRRNSVGGICSPGYVKNGHTLYLNSGLSTSRNHYGKRVITREADLVTAHEFGHNWGSEHDPDIPECSPNSRHGGSFLMYTYSVSGYDRNNKMFSPCSRRSIFAVLEAKAQKCFSEPEASFCGNSLVEENEQCDAGLIGSEDNDPCCDTDCKLRNGAVCSDKNSPCCRGCRLIVTGDICRQAQRNACKQEAYCNGRSAECPESKPQEDDKECLDRGRCKNGECVPFCETMGQHSCMCDQEKDACKRCCRSTLNSTCRPVPPEEILRDGTPCIHGYCEEGVCKKTVQDIVERFWDIVEDININTVLKFLNDNIVGTVIVISIIVWIPASCVINHFDNKKLKRKKELERERELIDRRQNETPFRVPTDGETRIIHIRGRSRPNNNQNNMGRGMPPLHPRPETERWEYRPRYNGASYRRTEPMPFPLHGVDYRPSRHYPYSRGRGQPPNPAEYRPTGSQPDIVEAYTAL